ncbi:MAG: phosphoglycerate kinase [Porticoccaceae bacterium]|nr:phosphoglycerate kinase [Porticoccaceae bacterium]
MDLLKMTSLNLTGKRLLIRADLNVPIIGGHVTSDARILAIIPTIQFALSEGASIILMSHLGRPIEGQFDRDFSLEPVANRLESELGKDVCLIKNWRDEGKNDFGEISLLENVRFNQGEKADDESLAQAYANLCDIFVMDAFGTAHRAHASTHGVAQYATMACAGPLLIKELEALAKALKTPKRPIMAIVGGSKVSGKLQLLERLSTQVDQLVIGGGILNTFLAATGISVGKSLFEEELISSARKLMTKVDIPLPVDLVVGKALSESSKATVRPVDKVRSDEMILDVGPDSANYLASLIGKMGTIIWNGPLGVFEYEQFGKATQTLALAIGQHNGFSIAGGGDTIAAVEKYGVGDEISYISTGGGAFLESVQGKELPGVEILKRRAVGG